MSIEQRARLERLHSYDEIVAAIAASARRGGVSLVIEPGTRTMPSDHSRPEFTIEVSSDLGDPFFSGPHGYRKAYSESIAEGVVANRTLIFMSASPLESGLY